MAAVSQRQAPRRTEAFPAALDYVAFAAFRAAGAPAALPRSRRQSLAAHALRTLAMTPDVALRGAYDTSGYRADISLLIWIAAPAPDQLQDALASFGQTPLVSALEPVWTAVGVHRRGEFARLDVPAFYRGESPGRYVCVSAMAHTAEWYLLEPHVRRRLLLDYTRAVRDYGDVHANTVSAFGLGDHEWLHAYESDQLTRIVDLVRHLRGTEVRRYTRPEARFITGVRKPLGAILAALP